MKTKGMKKAAAMKVMKRGKKAMKMCTVARGKLAKAVVIAAAFVAARFVGRTIPSSEACTRRKTRSGKELL